MRKGSHHSWEARTEVAASRLGISPDEYRARIHAGQRWCGKHRAWLPVEQFGATQKLSGYCKACSVEKLRAYRARRKQAAEAAS